MNDTDSITKEMMADLLTVFSKHGFAPVNACRNFRIKFEYEEKRKQQIPGKKAREKLAEEYNMSIKNIEFILYGKKK